RPRTGHRFRANGSSPSGAARLRRWRGGSRGRDRLARKRRARLRSETRTISASGRARILDCGRNGAAGCAAETDCIGGLPRGKAPQGRVTQSGITWLLAAAGMALAAAATQENRRADRDPEDMTTKNDRIPSIASFGIRAFHETARGLLLPR